MEDHRETQRERLDRIKAEKVQRANELAHQQQRKPAPAPVTAKAAPKKAAKKTTRKK
jgi:hypothetical protein